MKRSKWSGIPLIFLAVCALATEPVRGDFVVLESAMLGPTGQTGGLSIGDSQFVGARFTIEATTEITEVGGHLLSLQHSSIVASIIPLSGPTSLPSFTPSKLGANALASTLFAPPDPSDDALFPLSVILTPGTYGLVFSGAMGSGFVASMPQNNPHTAQASYFTAGSSPPGTPPPVVWEDEPVSQNLRFVVIGQAVPEPCSLILIGMGAAGLLTLVKLHRVDQNAAIPWSRR